MSTISPSLTGFVVVAAGAADARGRRRSVNRRYRPPFARLVCASQDAIRRGLVLGGAPGPASGQGLPQPDGASHDFGGSKEETRARGGVVGADALVRRRRRPAAFFLSSPAWLALSLSFVPLKVRAGEREDTRELLS